MNINWLALGWEGARLVAYTFVSVLAGGILYARYVQPELLEALGEAQETVTQLAKLAGVKSAEYRDSKGIEKAVARDIIEQKIPELELIKTFISPATWEEIQDTIDNNPEAVLQLWDKYGHLLQGQLSEQDPKYNY